MDFRMSNHGTLIGFTMLTQAARDWAKEHLPSDAQWLGNTVYVEHRYGEPIYNGLIEDGLEGE